VFTSLRLYDVPHSDRQERFESRDVWGYSKGEDKARLTKWRPYSRKIGPVLPDLMNISIWSLLSEVGQHLCDSP